MCCVAACQQGWKWTCYALLNLGNRHLFTTLAVILSIMALYLVEQVNHVLFQIPIPQEVNWYEFHYVFSLWSWAVFTPVIYALLAVAVIPRPSDTCSEFLYRKAQAITASKRTLLVLAFLWLMGVLAWWVLVMFLPDSLLWWERNSFGLVYGWLPWFLLFWGLMLPRAKWGNYCLAELISLWLVGLAGVISSRTRVVTSLLIVLLGAGWWFFPLFLADDSHWILFWSRPIRIATFIIAMPLSVWLWCGNRFGHSLVWKIVGRALGLIILTNVFGELLLWTAPDWCPWASYRNYTIWAVFNLLFLIVLGGRVIDACQEGTGVPLRFFTLLIILGGMIFLRSPQVGSQVDEAPKGDALTKAWLDQMEKRLDDTDPEAPVIMVAASGGGSRAAIFTSLILESMENEVNLQGPRGQRLVKASKQIVLISGVSGGSLASAYYVNAVAKRDQPERGRDLKNSIPGEIANRMPLEAKELLELAKDEEKIRIWKNTKKDCDLIQKQETTTVAPWLLESGFVDDMCTDFMAPLLRGALVPGLERGEAVTLFWEKRFGWHGVTNHSGFLPSAKNPALNPAKVPLLFLNSCDTSDGFRLVAGFPGVSPGFFEDPIRSISDLNPGYRVSLAEAVRLSANFPYAFEVPHLRPADPQQPKEIKKIPVLDGGLVDNTGLDTMVQALSKLEGLAMAKLKNPLQLQARKIWNKLCEQGVALVEIDSGLKPGSPNFLQRSFPSVFKPVEGLEKSLEANYFTRAKIEHVEEIRRHFQKGVSLNGEKGDSCAQIPRFFHITFVCNHSKDVMTAWAMGPRDKATIFVQFLHEAHWRWPLLAKFLADVPLAQLKKEQWVKAAPEQKQEIQAWFEKYCKSYEKVQVRLVLDVEATHQEYAKSADLKKSPQPADSQKPTDKRIPYGRIMWHRTFQPQKAFLPQEFKLRPDFENSDIRSMILPHEQEFKFMRQEGVKLMKE